MLKMDCFINHTLGSSCLLCSAAINHTSHSTQNITNDICASCRNLLPTHSRSCCPKCGLGNTDTVCGQCLQSAPHFDNTYARFTYDYPIDHVLQQFKYGQRLSLTSMLANLMLQTKSRNHIDYLIPMPMHPKRLKERGYNQSIEIAKILGKQMDVPVKLDACERIIHTAPQASLALKERAKNIKGAFKATCDLTGKHVTVIDDVMTSGASLNELAKTLKQAGAAHVTNWVVARTLP